MGDRARSRPCNEALGSHSHPKHPDTAPQDQRTHLGGVEPLHSSRRLFEADSGGAEGPGGQNASAEHALEQSTGKHCNKCY